MSYSAAYQNFRNKEFESALSLWVVSLQDNALNWPLQNELIQAREDIVKIDLPQARREYLNNQLDCIISWFGLERHASVDLKKLSTDEVVPFSILLYDDCLVISDEGSHRLLMITMEGDLIREIGEKGIDAGKFWYPAGLALYSPSENKKDDLFICCDCWNHRLQVFSAEGNFIKEIGEFGEHRDAFKGPYDIALCDDDSFWVADRANHRIKRITLDGQTLEVVGSAWGDASSPELSLEKARHDTLGQWIPAKFQYPGGILLDDVTQELIVADRNYSCIRIRKDKMKSRFGSTGPIMPRTLTTDKHRFLVKDEVTNDIYCFTPQGFPVCKLSSKQPVFPLRNQSRIIQFSGKQIDIYQFRKKDVLTPPYWIKHSALYFDDRRFAYAIRECSSNGSLKEEVPEILEKKSVADFDNYLFFSLAELWEKEGLFYGRLSEHIDKYIDSVDKELSLLYNDLVGDKYYYDRQLTDDFHKRSKDDRELDESIEELVNELNRVRNELVDDATLFLVKLQEWLQVVIKTLKFVFITADESSAKCYAHLIMDFLSKWDNVIWRYKERLPEALLEGRYNNQVKEIYLEAVDLIWEKEEYSRAFTMWEIMLSFDPANERIRNRLEALIRPSSHLGLRNEIYNNQLLRQHTPKLLEKYALRSILMNKKIKIDEGMIDVISSYLMCFNNNIFVFDSINERIYRFDLNGNFIAPLDTEKNLWLKNVSIYHLNPPFWRDEFLYLSLNNDNKLYKIGIDTNYIEEIVVKELNKMEGYFSACDRGIIYIDINTSNYYEINQCGEITFAQYIGHRIKNPNYCYVDDEHLYILSTKTSKIFSFDPYKNEFSEIYDTKRQNTRIVKLATGEWLLGGVRYIMKFTPDFKPIWLLNTPVEIGSMVAVSEPNCFKIIAGNYCSDYIYMYSS